MVNGNSQHEDYHKISPTAVTCARARADYTDMRYAKEILEQVKEITGEDGFKGTLSPILRWAIERSQKLRSRVSTLEGRYLSTSDAVQALGQDCTILEIASGLSPRSLEYADGNRLYVETDLPEMIDTKREIVQAIRAREGRPITMHSFYPLNALDYSQLVRVGEHLKLQGNDKPVAIVHEGLLMYLDKPEQERLRDNFARFLREYSPNGAWISPDLAVRNMKRGFLMNLVIRAITKKTGRKFNRFNHPDQVSSFLSEGGLIGEFFPNDNVIDQLTCTDKCDLDQEVVRKLALEYQACFAQLER